MRACVRMTLMRACVFLCVRACLGRIRNQFKKNRVLYLGYLCARVHARVYAMYVCASGRIRVKEELVMTFHRKSCPSAVPLPVTVQTILSLQHNHEFFPSSLHLFPTPQKF